MDGRNGSWLFLASTGHQWEDGRNQSSAVRFQRRMLKSSSVLPVARRSDGPRNNRQPDARMFSQQFRNAVRFAPVSWRTRNQTVLQGRYECHAADRPLPYTSRSMQLSGQGANRAGGYSPYRASCKSFDILAPLKESDSYGAKQGQTPVESLRWVPASPDGPTAPFLHRPTRHALPLRC